VQESLDKTIQILSNPKRISAENITRYRASLQQVKLRLGRPLSTKTHLSLTTSACLENPQSEGGKASYLVKECKKLLCKDALGVEAVEGLYDHLGFKVFYEGISSFYKLGIELHDLAYLPVEEAQAYLEGLDLSKERVPFDYAKSILLTASKLLEESKIGHFLDRRANPLGIPLFRSKTKFIVDVKAIDTKASIVLEKGGKTRLVTTTLAAKALIEQLMAHMVREYLSNDPLHRVGFDEPDKLWTVLKQYAKERDTSS
jgi:hypothetical protein